ncbi:CAP domain-containing protein [Streptomyces sp. NBC_00859]|uniref:CAP domain-containing protein n=1 Tax=Streptomyces sp. NBC_00859 TaxID=2903682 RepID=UPI00386D376C|nr:CAP domain-containing protein [Streptomyces sp. NBC_00859]
MGRHRRSAAAPAAVEYPAGPESGRRNHGRGRGTTPVRTGLLGVSAAVAVGAVAMASGLLPGGGSYAVDGSGGSDQVRADGVPDLQAQGGSSASPASGAPSSPAAPSATRAHAPSASPSPRTPKSSAVPSQRKKSSPATRSGSPSAAPARAAAPGAAPRHTTEATAHTDAAGSAESTAAASVLSLVNQHRAQAGCRPLRPDAALASLAGSFSDEMASRGFFDHTDPDGATPWDRADKAGVQHLGGENIARGQTDAASVMDSWMNSPGHRANILNCDFRTLGVGVHFGTGGPWWTQDFGY